jgi:hypothetical protein
MTSLVLKHFSIPFHASTFEGIFFINLKKNCYFFFGFRFGFIYTLGKKQIKTLASTRVFSPYVSSIYPLNFCFLQIWLVFSLSPNVISLFFNMLPLFFNMCLPSHVVPQCMFAISHNSSTYVHHFFFLFNVCLSLLVVPQHVFAILHCCKHALECE